MMLETTRRFSIKRCAKWLVSVAVLFIIMKAVLVFLAPVPRAWYHQTEEHRQSTGHFIRHFLETRMNLNRTMKILLWTPWFGDHNWGETDLTEAFQDCPVSNCVLTVKKSEIVQTDAVVFHAFDLWNYFFGYQLPKHRHNDQVWILYNFEAPPNTPLEISEYQGVFNWTGSYRKDSDLYIPPLLLERRGRRDTFVADVASTKSAGIAWVASNCGDDARRQLLVRELEKHIPIDKFGHCGDKQLPSNQMDGVLKKYKFYLSFENSYCRDYITEKFTNSLRRRVIPIVAGGGNYDSVAPPYSYIHVRDFTSIKDLATYLKYLEKNNSAYNSYFDWTREFSVMDPFSRRWCKLCRSLHDVRQHQVYSDLIGYFKNDMCSHWTIFGYIFRVIQGYALRFGFV